MINNILNYLLNNYEPIIASITAVIIVVLTFKSLLISKKTQSISQKQYDDKQSNFSIYIINSYRYHVQDDLQKKILLFHCTINNRSENKNTYRAFLEIKYIRHDNTNTKIIIEHNPEIRKLIPQEIFSVFPVDIRMEEKAMESKWLLFIQPFEAVKFYRIDKFTVSIKDASDNVSHFEEYIIKDLKIETIQGKS